MNRLESNMKHRIAYMKQLGFQENEAMWKQNRGRAVPAFCKTTILHPNQRTMKRLPNLPIGQQYFKSIRHDNGVYVDKTAYIYQLCKPLDKGYFLSRPRRFGKSLTLDTIAELFSGNRPLFEGLWIQINWIGPRPIPSFDCLLK